MAKLNRKPRKDLTSRIKSSKVSRIKWVIWLNIILTAGLYVVMLRLDKYLVDLLLKLQ